MPIPREFNSKAEKTAAERRARVAAAVNRQEILDREEIRWGGPGSRVAADPGAGDEVVYDDDGNLISPDDDDEEEKYFDDDEPRSNILLHLADAPEDPSLLDKAKNWSWLWGVGVFAIFLVGAVLLFWDDMHTQKLSGRPEVEGAATENVKDEAAEYGTSVRELATEIQEEAQDTIANAEAAGPTGAPAPEAAADAGTAARRLLLSTARRALVGYTGLDVPGF